MSSQKKIGVIGAGNWSTYMHLPSLQVIQKKGLAQYQAVCDLDNSLAKEYAKALGHQNTYSDLEIMLQKENLDGVAILVPPAVSAKIIELAIKHQTPFICEKPPAPSVAKQQELIQKVGTLKHTIAYNRRFSPYIQQAIEWTKNEELISITAQFCRHRRMDPDFSSTAVHGIDGIQTLGRAEFKSLRIEGNKRGGVSNFYLNGWSTNGIRYDLLVTPNTASAEERYVIRSVNKTVIISFPQRAMYDLPGFVELHIDNSVKERKTAKDFHFDKEDYSSLGGILAEHEAFLSTLDGGASLSTLPNTLRTQVIREKISDHLSNDFFSVELNF